MSGLFPALFMVCSEYEIHENEFARKKSAGMSVQFTTDRVDNTII